MSNSPNGWEEHKKLVLHRLDQIEEDMTDANKMLSRIMVELATLKVKASAWGALAGVIPVALYLAIKAAIN